jgi:poly(A) polymerase Pap1
MGCGGGYRDLFRAIDYHSHSHNNYRSNDTEEKITLVKKMYAEGLIDDTEYQNYKNKIYDRITSFDDLVSLRSERKRNIRKSQNDEYKKVNSNESNNKYKIKLRKLRESKEKIDLVQEKLENNIEELKKEKEKMQKIAEHIVTTSEESAEKHINKRIDIEESIQNLIRRKKELDQQSQKINLSIKNLKSKELELEAVKLQEEISNITKDFE